MTKLKFILMGVKGTSYRQARRLIPKPIKKLKHKFIVWLASELIAEQEHRRPPIAATFAPTATLGPEGKIENIAGDNERIIIGDHSYIRGRLLTYGHGGCISTGQWCYVGVRSEIWSMDSVTIGNRVLIAHDVNIHDGMAHSLDENERHAHFRHILEKDHPRTPEILPGVSSAPIVIEDDVWISFGVTILKGVHIGAGSVIAAGSMVTKNVPPGVLYRCQVKPIITPLPLQRAI